MGYECETDLVFKAELNRLVPFPATTLTWRAVEERVRRKRTHRRATGAVAAAVVVAAAAYGGFSAYAALRPQEAIVVINDPNPLEPQLGAPSTSSTPLPAPGSSILLAPTDAAVPQDKLLEVTTRASTPGEVEYSLLDTHSRRGYREMASPCPTPGYSIMIFDDSGHRAMDGVTLEVYPEPASGEKSASYSQIVNDDQLAGKTATVTGAEVLEGRQTVVVETTLSMPGGPSVTVVANLDLLTGLRVREKWEIESQTRFIERKLVDPTAALLAKLDKQAILGMAAEFLEEREQRLSDLPYPARGFAEGTEGLSLLWIIPGRDWTSVRLEYQSPSTIGRPAVTVITYDLTADTEAAPLFSVPLEKAALLTEEGSDVLRFRDGDTGIQIQAAAGTSRDLALKLLVVGGPGSK